VNESVREPARATLERVAIRTRESGVTLAAWKIVPEGQASGAITVVEIGGRSVYRGEGTFLGSPQAELEAEYRRLLPKPPDPMPDPGQFG
jgi:hypothetical protein